MRNTIVSAVLGGGVAAGILLGAGAIGDPARTVYLQSPVPGRPATGGLTAAEIYRRDAAGVAFIRARTADTTESTGSGFVLDGDGRIVTNAHVIEGAKAVTVTLSGDRTRPARVVGADESTDLAVLEIDPRGIDLHPLALGRSAGLEVGDPTVAIGNPFGFDRTLTTGVVSALQRRITAPDGYAIDDVIQTDAAINPGNSGGPLIDVRGRVIGVTSQIATGANGGSGSVGIGFAVPIDTARPIVRDLVQTGHVERPWLGVEVVALTASMSSLDVGTDRGLLVQRVVPGSPAAGAGIVGGTRSVILNTGSELLLGGDIVQRVGGQATDAPGDLQTALARRAPGDTVAVEVLRSGEPVTVRVALGDRPAGSPPG